MRELKDSNNKTYSARLKTSNLDLIEQATGLQIDDVFGDEDPIPQLLLAPRKLWKVVRCLLSEKIAENYPEEEPDVTELFDIDVVFAWLRDLITDFHPQANSSRISKLFEELQTNGDEVIGKYLEKRQQLVTLMANPTVIESLTKNPRALSALAGGSEV